MGWNLGWKDDADCGFVQVIDFRYRVYFNYLGFILTPLVIMALIYVYIFTIVKAQIRDIASLQVEFALTFGTVIISCKVVSSGLQKFPFKESSHISMPKLDSQIDLRSFSGTECRLNFSAGEQCFK